MLGLVSLAEAARSSGALSVASFGRVLACFWSAGSSSAVRSFVSAAAAGFVVGGGSVAGVGVVVFVSASAWDVRLAVGGVAAASRVRGGVFVSLAAWLAAGGEVCGG